MYTSYYEGFVRVRDYLNDWNGFTNNMMILSRKEPFPEYIGVSIAGRPHPCFKGHEFTALRAELFFLNQYKKDEDEAAYTESYYKYVLSKFTPEALYDILRQRFGENAVLLCYEKPGEFCHRRLVAEYLQRALGIRVPELDIETIEIKAKANELNLNKKLPILNI